VGPVSSVVVLSGSVGVAVGLGSFAVTLGSDVEGPPLSEDVGSVEGELGSGLEEPPPSGVGVGVEAGSFVLLVPEPTGVAVEL